MPAPPPPPDGPPRRGSAAVDPEVTRLLGALGHDGAAEARLLPLVYDELRRLAHRQRARAAGETLNTTALVHEAFLKLAGHGPWENRRHFFCVAARAMRHVLVDYARARQAARRDVRQTARLDDALPFLADAPLFGEHRDEEVLALHDALTRLAALDERMGQVVELRYFAGFSVDETAEALALSPATVKREWATARAWLHRAMTA